MDDFGLFWLMEDQEILESELRKCSTEEERQQVIERMQTTAIITLIGMFALFFAIILVVGIVKWII